MKDQEIPLPPAQNTGEVQEKAYKPIPKANAKKWRERIYRSKRAMKPFKEEMDRFQRMYKGDYSDKPNKKRRFDKMSVNIIYSHVEIITPSVFTGFPYIKVRPKPKAGLPLEKAEQSARNMELTLNYWFKELALDEELKDVFFDTFFSWAGVEVGWETDILEKEEKYLDEHGAEKTSSSIAILKDKPFITRREPECIIMDPDAKRRRECRWLAVEEVFSYNDFISSSKWTESAKKKVKPQCYPVDSNNEDGPEEGPKKSDKEWMRLWTIWDKENKRKLVVTEGYDGFCNTDDPEGEVFDYELDYKSDCYPICIHDGKKDTKSPYSWSEFRAYESQVVELNRIRSAIQIHVQRSLPKYIYTDAFGTRADVAKLMNARSDEASKVNNLEAIKSLEVAQIPPDIYNFNKMSHEDLLNVSGLFEYQNQSIADTATEASLIQGRAQIRKSIRSRNWENFIVEIAGKLAQLCQHHMDTQIAVEIAGPEGVDWLNIDKHGIQGEFFYDIEPGIMEYKNEAMRTQQLLKFAEIANQNPNINARAILTKLARFMDLSAEDLIVPEDQLPPPPPPEPNVKIKDIVPTEITDPAIQNAIILAALKQNGIELQMPPGGPMGPQGSGPPQEPQGFPGQGQQLAISGKDLAGGNPNGNPNLPPAEGNIADLGGISF